MQAREALTFRCSLEKANKKSQTFPAYEEFKVKTFHIWSETREKKF